MTTTDATMTVTVPLDMTALLSAVWDNLTTTYSPWIQSFSFDWENNDGTETVAIKYEDPDTEGVNTTQVTPQMLADAFSQMVGKSVWGSHISIDPEDMDALQADSCLQIALFGKEVYA